ncbi:glycosyltransferase family 4 protein [Flavobacterium sp. NRK F10]|uniref:glycosyltransferase family 4 protein n=1 Tax=Flavobacterium sp. NRK F10 TaxID=2954931 RepID=UPI002091A325|nr:glycosyltransferase family 4 protein [Flavobacterium sp. NRK F10]MCO6175971.1 glycosyltransferase family 4 protein [Flavobacterium sp. NRK F10]
MQKLVIIGSVWPEPESTAAGSRMLQLITLFQEMNFEISFLSAATANEFSFDVSQWNIAAYSIQLNHDSFDELITKLHPDVVVFDRFMIEEQFGWRVAENCPDALRILDTEDLHFLRKARETAFRQNRTLRFDDYLNDTFKRELASIYRCDLSLIISKFEMELLTQTFKVDPVLLEYLPFLVETDILSDKPSFSEREHFVSIGNFWHEPNWQTVLQLKKLWKSVKKQIPQAELHIYGAYATDKVYQLHNEKEGFLIKGRANSVEEVFSKARVLLAPIPYGAGLKGKLLESMLFGLPNVTTEIGAEAMKHSDLWNGCIADDESEFVEKAVELYTNKRLWNQCRQNGFVILRNEFDRELFTSHFQNRIQHLLENLEAHRRQNFLGHVLQHQSLQSTKFMSKWIELKNK